MSKVIAIYDGDILAFRASAAVEKRTVKVTHISSDKSKVFDTRTQFKDFLKDKGKEYIKEDYTFEDLQEAEPIANCLSILKNQIEKINDTLFADEFIIGVGGKGNFRDSLPLPKKYKGNREGGIKPIHLDAAKKYLIKYHNAIVVNKHEVDDLLIYRGYEYLDKGYIPIIVGVDKDSYSHSGLTMYNFTHENPELELIPELGELREVKSGIKGTGLKFLAYQWICSDPVDNYCAYDLSSIKFGPKSAYKVLKDCKDEKEVIEAVINQFKTFYPEPFKYKDWQGIEHDSDWKGMMQLYYQCCQMMRTKDDKLDSKEFISKYNKEV
jgi:hypothetical protein